MTSYNINKIFKYRNILRKKYCITDNDEVVLNETKDTNSIGVYKNSKSNIYIPFFIDEIFIYVFRSKRRQECDEPELYIYTTKL